MESYKRTRVELAEAEAWRGVPGRGAPGSALGLDGHDVAGC